MLNVTKSLLWTRVLATQFSHGRLRIVSATSMGNKCVDEMCDGNCLPAVRNDILLDKSRFDDVIPMLVVGLVCDSKFSRVCQDIKSCFHTFIRIPRLTRTYRDSLGLLRKLMLLHPSSFDDGSPSFALLRSHNIEISFDPCPLDESVDATHVFQPTRTPQAMQSSLPTLVPDMLDAIKGPGRMCLRVGYENYPFEATLRALLPNHVSPISGFTMIGHVAHFNLKPDALPFRRLIGQVALDKLANIRTVIHKAASIDSTYRTFQIDLMAGDPDYVTAVKEHNLTFHLDVSKVYWNSRLEAEHSRIIDRLLKPMICGSHGAKVGQLAPEHVVVYDIFAGVGPFAIPAARLGCQVLANDLNPDSYKWLEHNISANRSRKRRLENIRIFNMDGREFIRQVLLPHYREALTKEEKPHRFVVVMNLPAAAPEFMDAFVDESLVESDYALLTVPVDFYCYCFVRRNVEDENTVKERITKALEPSRTADSEDCGLQPTTRLRSWTLRLVRNVAPFKDMYCAEFQLWFAATRNVAEGTFANGAMENKKQRLEADL